MSALPYRDDLVVYTGDKRGFRRSEVKPLFDRQLLGNKPVVLFVHGRGDEPEKSLNGTNFVFAAFGFEGLAVAKLEKYGATVVLLSWDSKRGRGRRDRTRPLANMPVAQERFGFVLDRLAESITESESAGRPAPPMILVAHSMGTIVVQRYVESRGGWSPRGSQALFDHVILTSSDADNTGHTTWVDRIGSVERVFITVNPEDGTLEDSAGEPREVTGAKPLGQDPGSVVSNAATYIHMENTTAHEIFEQKPRNPEITTFFRSVITNTEVRLGRRTGGPGQQFHLK